MVIVQALARADSITNVIMQPGIIYMLCEVLGAHQERVIGLTHSTGQEPCDIMPAGTCQMCDNVYSTVFSLEYKAEKNVYEVSFQQCHAYTNVDNQFGEVDRKEMYIKAVKVDQYKTRT